MKPHRGGRNAVIRNFKEIYINYKQQTSFHKDMDNCNNYDANYKGKGINKDKGNNNKGKDNNTLLTLDMQFLQFCIDNSYYNIPKK